MPILTPEERLGQTIADRYRLDSQLCAGGMGVLFRARDTRDACDVAVKMLKPSHACEPDRVARFLRETTIARRVVHPNVARTLDVWIDPAGVPFLIMELLEGRTLACELERVGTLPLAQTLAIMGPIARALDAVHGLGVIHRDIKPSNIFLCSEPDGSTLPKLLDFGIAKSPECPFETQTGMLLGTPGYIAPEQAQFGHASELTDVWAVGAVLYRCLTGHAPHAGSGMADTFSKLIHSPVPPLAAAGVSKRAAATIDRALALDPHHRYPSMKAFGRALAELEEDRGLDTRDLVTSAAQLRAAAPRTTVRPSAFAAALSLSLLAFAPESAGSTDRSAFARPSAAPTPPQAPERALVARPAPMLPPAAAESTTRAAESMPPIASPRPARRNRVAHRPPPSAAADTPRALEREATTGLPVAVEW
jgi:eukaryotic-like serine/threonine-protein kinase